LGFAVSADGSGVVESLGFEPPGWFERPPLPVPTRRYTIVVADRRTGVYRRFGMRLLPTILATLLLFALPMLIGLGLRWSARAEIADLRADAERLEVENRSFRTATGQLTSQIQALQNAIGDLGARVAVDPETANAMRHLPRALQTRAAGGPLLRLPSTGSLFTPSITGSAEDTFGILRDLLYTLESRLQVVQTDVDKRQALAAATPSIWPTRGWLSDGFGQRTDPFTGDVEYHTGLDISADRGEPVMATANGTVGIAQRSGAYGNMVVIDHGFGLSTRYAHLDSFHVKPGDRVRRGDVVGYAGATGRATGDHLHYEILVSGRQMNPLQFLLNRAQH
jgi:murein DD-endopeptidase MepM/ murein hydrolase activator NlpD